MKKRFLAAGLIAASMLALTAKVIDPVLMKVAGKDVPLSEFEYLYHKNNTQQVNPQSIDEYVGMFVDYKLKVADAEAAGVDTTAEFREEFNKFRNELSEPYMRDDAKLDSLMQEAYSHMQQEVLVSHIMVAPEQRRLIDSLRNEIAAGNVTFDDAARKFSIDTPSAKKGGLMGFVIPGRFPWSFEKAAYETEVGQISPVVNSGLGLHLIRVEKKEPNVGEVNVAHIIRLTQGNANNEEQKRIIDSLYQIIKADPSKFEELAKKFSQDGSASKGGELGWFGRGMTVAEFENMAYSLPNGAISEPFKSDFGWHIIKKIDSRGVGSFEANKDKIKAAIEHSDRSSQPEIIFLQKQRGKYNAALVDNTYEQIKTIAGQHNNKLDSAMMLELKTSTLPAYKIDQAVFTVGNVLSGVNVGPIIGASNISSFIRNQAVNDMNEKIREIVRDDLYRTNDDYRNLVNEYRDGILLFEISNRNVWNKASKDKDGLENFFNQNRAKYAWDSPRFKSYIFFAKTDSVLEAAVEYAKSAPQDMTPSDFVKYIRDKFGRDIKVERVIASKGENAIVDYLGFNGPKPEENKNWPFCKAVNGRMLEAPEEAADVRGAVVSDYQNALEKAWLENLHKKYSVKINDKVLKKVK